MGIVMKVILVIIYLIYVAVVWRIYQNAEKAYPSTSKWQTIWYIVFSFFWPVMLIFGILKYSKADENDTPK